MQVLAPASVRFDVFTMDPMRGILLRDGADVPLRRQSFEVLRYLAEHAGRAVSNDELVQAVWVSRPADPAASVWQCIKEVRRALGQDARWIVKTVSGRGYEFKAAIARSAAEIPEPSGTACPPASAPGAGPALRARRVRWRAVAAAAACTALAAMYLSGQFASPSANHRAAVLSAAEAARPSPAPAAPVAALYSPGDARRVAELAASKELPLPPFEMRAPGHEVPADVRRFVGIWASDAGWTGSNRQYMLIITNADTSGVVTGYHVNGPPRPGSRFQTPAHFSAFKGNVSSASLAMEDAGGRFVGSFLDQQRIQLNLTFRDGLVARVLLDPVWMLVNVEPRDAAPRVEVQAR